MVVVEVVVVIGVVLELSKVGFLCSYRHPQFQCFRQMHVTLTFLAFIQDFFLIPAWKFETGTASGAVQSLLCS